MDLMAWLFVGAAFGAMDGGCADFKDNKQELAIWNADASRVFSEQRAELPMWRKLTLKLEPQEKLQFPAKPEKLIIKNGKAFGGIFSFKPKTNSTFRVSLGQRVWLDVVEADTKQIVKSSAHDMQTKCDKMVKMVSYNLAAGKNYLFQINSSPTENLDATVVVPKEEK